MWIPLHLLKLFKLIFVSVSSSITWDMVCLNVCVCSVMRRPILSLIAITLSLSFHIFRNGHAVIGAELCPVRVSRFITLKMNFAFVASPQVFPAINGSGSVVTLKISLAADSHCFRTMTVRFHAVHGFVCALLHKAHCWLKKP